VNAPPEATRPPFGGVQDFGLIVDGDLPQGEYNSRRKVCTLAYFV